MTLDEMKNLVSTCPTGLSDEILKDLICSARLFESLPDALLGDVDTTPFEQMYGKQMEALWKKRAEWAR